VFGLRKHPNKRRKVLERALVLDKIAATMNLEGSLELKGGEYEYEDEYSEEMQSV
jgi:hypothetical protein